MSKYLKITLAITALAAIGLGIYIVPYVWIRVGSTEASRPTGNNYQAKVYKSMHGDLLFVIEEDSMVDEYIVYPDGQIGIPSISQFMISPVAAFSTQVPVSAVPSTDKIKAESDMNIIVTGKTIEFTTFRGLRIKAEMDNF